MKTKLEHLEIQKEEARKQDLTVIIKGELWIERAMESYAKERAVEFGKHIKSLPMYVNYFPPNPTSMEAVYDEFINNKQP